MTLRSGCCTCDPTLHAPRRLRHPASTMQLLRIRRQLCELHLPAYHQSGLGKKCCTSHSERVQLPRPTPTSTHLPLQMPEKEVSHITLRHSEYQSTQASPIRYFRSTTMLLQSAADSEEWRMAIAMCTGAQE